MGLEASLVGSDNAYALSSVADRNAAAAKDTLVVVSYHVGGGEVDIVLHVLALVLALVVNAHVMAHFLQLAVFAPYAGGTLLLMC